MFPALLTVMMMNPTTAPAPSTADPPKKVNEPDPAKPVAVKDVKADPRFTERVMVRRYVGEKDFDFLIPNANVPALRREVTLRGGVKETWYYLSYAPNMQPKSEITAADGSVWAVAKWTGSTAFDLKDGKGPLYAAKAIVTLKTPAPEKK